MSATDSPDAPIRVLAGDCTVVYDGDRREEHRGRVTVVVKPETPCSSTTPRGTSPWRG